LLFGFLIRPRVGTGPEPGNARLKKPTQFLDLYKLLIVTGEDFFGRDSRNDHLVKKFAAQGRRTSGAEARVIFEGLTARLKVVPFPIPLEREFVRKLRSRAFPLRIKTKVKSDGRDCLADTVKIEILGPSTYSLVK
jgi:hypothetical protein